MKQFKICVQTVINIGTDGASVKRSKAVAHYNEGDVEPQYLDVPLYGERVLWGDANGECVYITRDV